MRSLSLKRLYRDKGFAPGFLVKSDNPVDFGMQGVVFAHIHIVTGIVLGSTLTYDDISGNGFLSAKNLYAQAFRF